MTNNNNLKPIIENKKPFELVQKIDNKYKIPSFEEFMKTYQSEGKINNNYELEVDSYGDIGVAKGYGPCINSLCGCNCSSRTCTCKSDEVSFRDKDGFRIGNHSVAIRMKEKEREASGEISTSAFRLKDHTGDLKILSGSVGGRADENGIGFRVSADAINFKSSGFEGRAGISLDSGFSKDSDGVEIKLGGVGVHLGKKMGISTPVGEIKVDTDECVIQ